MKQLILTSITAGVLASSALLLAQGQTKTEDPNRPRTEDQSRADRQANPDVTYAKVKEFTAGKKIVLDVDNALDKSYDLTDKDTAVQLSAGLKVGDSVKITERDVNGKKMVDISADSSAERTKLPAEQPAKR